MFFIKKIRKKPTFNNLIHLLSNDVQNETICKVGKYKRNFTIGGGKRKRPKVYITGLKWKAINSLQILDRIILY